jgi:Spy/CpxP family protein refolding chaperone
MVTLRKVIPTLCLATSLAGIAAYAQTAATTTPATTTPGAHQWHHHGHHGGMFFVLHKLNLTAEQKTQIKSIMAGKKSQFEALRTSAKANRTALATTAPTDSGYPALMQTEQTNAMTRLKLKHETWSEIYSVLTKAQQAAIPGVVAAAQQAREARMAAWKAQHAQAAPTSD